MCNDVLRLRAQLGGDWVVTFGLPTRSTLDIKVYKYISIFLLFGLPTRSALDIKVFFYYLPCQQGLLQISKSTNIFLQCRSSRDIVRDQLRATIVELTADEATIRERLMRREKGVGLYFLKMCAPLHVNR